MPIMASVRNAPISMKVVARVRAERLAFRAASLAGRADEPSTLAAVVWPRRRQQGQVHLPTVRPCERQVVTRTTVAGERPAQEAADILRDRWGCPQKWQEANIDHVAVASLQPLG
jgi:hypothetical protein